MKETYAGKDYFNSSALSHTNKNLAFHCLFIYSLLKPQMSI